MDMREKVARAIADANMEDFEALQNLHFGLADAAMEAMREPTPRIVLKGAEAAWKSKTFPSENVCRDIYQAMIDAARGVKP